jgi:hypothetical protein
MAHTRNAPARKGEGAAVSGKSSNAHSTAQAQVQYLAGRHGLSFHRAALLAPIAFGVLANG